MMLNRRLNPLKAWAKTFVVGVVFLALHSSLPPKALASESACLREFKAAKNLATYSANPTFDKIVFLTPGALLKSEDYQGLIHQIQLAQPETLILSYDPGLRTPLAYQLKSKLKAVFKILKNCSSPNMTAPDFFLAGHSMGGISAQEVWKDFPIDALILLGSYLTRKHANSEGNDSILHHKLPTLTLGGELDGFTRLPRLIENWQVLSQTFHYSQGFEIPAFPIVVLEGINHFQFANGKVDPEDAVTEVTLEEAHTKIADVITLFTEMHSKAIESEEISASLEKFSAYLKHTKFFVDQWSAAKNFDQAACSDQMQQKLQGLGVIEGNYQPEIKTKQFNNRSNFAMSKPSLKISDQKIEIEVMQHIRINPNPFDISKFPQSPTAIACKLKSEAAILENLRSEFEDSPSSASSCASYNIKTFKSVFSLLSTKQLNRWQKLDAQFEILPDKFYGTGISWVASNIQRNQKSNTFYEFRLPALYTKVTFAKPFEGMHYCTLLPAQKILEIVSLESQFSKYL